MAVAMAASQGVALSSSGLRSVFTGERSQVFGCGLGQKGESKVGCKRVESRVLGVRAQAGGLDHIPKQFRKDGLKEGLSRNFDSCPPSLYGLNPSQMDMFMVENNPYQRQAERVTEASISSASRYQDGTGMWSATGLDGAPSRLSMSVSMYRGGGSAGGRPKTAPPDLPSLLLDARICYLGMAIVPAVTELIIAELLWLDFDNPSKPIYFYINSSGTQNEKKESIGFETEAYAIADTIRYVKSKVYTINCGQAFGQAAMLLSIGEKGFRALQPSSSTKLYSPKVNQSSGSSTDMWIKGRELDANTDYYIDLLATGTGKPREEIANDIRRPKYFRPQEAIDYGLADKIIEPRGIAMEKRNYDEMLAQSKAQRPRAAAAPAGAGGR
ncbi:hypothetical protein KC19_5G141900 [Ceratodon purpureus]|uniref:ATP-dependent Clp protease proteolytic subunit n=1 Tax=Ceratodon purpureus TaxID=3225 RepID=A0A8T0I1D4_CERPU|nr:hypothetical protein KC19_5G141900 [Ceratodon purpureus]